MAYVEVILLRVDQMVVMHPNSEKCLLGFALSSTKRDDNRKVSRPAAMSPKQD